MLQKSSLPLKCSIKWHILMKNQSKKFFTKRARTALASTSLSPSSSWHSGSLISSICTSGTRWGSLILLAMLNRTPQATITLHAFAGFILSPILKHGNFCFSWPFTCSMKTLPLLCALYNYNRKQIKCKAIINFLF